jgi:hypothetical protein
VPKQSRFALDVIEILPAVSPGVVRRLDPEVVASKLGVSPAAVARWRVHGVPKGSVYLEEVGALIRKPPPKVTVTAKVVAELVAFFEGKVAEVAKAVGAAPATLRAWTKTGGSGPIAERILALHATEKKAAEERQVFAELMKIAGEVGVLPTVKSGDQERSGKKTEGWRWDYRVNRALSTETIAMMVRLANGTPKKFPLWQIAVVTSQYALSPRADFGLPPRPGSPNYKTVIVQLKHVKTGEFAVEHVQPTAERRSLEAVVAEMVEDFTSLLDSGEVKVFVHGVTVFNYRRRSRREQQRYETEQRKERERKWKKKQKRRRRQRKRKTRVQTRKRSR